MKKYLFVLENRHTDNRLSGHAHTLLGVRHIFKKVSNSNKCSVYRKVGITYSNTPFITYQK